MKKGRRFAGLFAVCDALSVATMRYPRQALLIDYPTQAKTRSDRTLRLETLMIAAIPLMIIPFILYNLTMVGLVGDGGVAVLEKEVFSLHMMSGATWTMSLGDLLVLVGLIFLFLEILKATRRSSSSILDHMLSLVLFVIFLVEFLLVASAANHVFFILMAVCLIDVLAGFVISIRSAARDVSIGL